MYKFRSETWGKKVSRDRDWTTCYADMGNGYGHFFGENNIRLRKLPKEDGWKPRLPPRASEALAPKVDHMWDVLRRKNEGPWGIGPNARARLRYLLREQQKRRISLREERDKAKAQLKLAKNKKAILPHLDTIKEDEVLNSNYPGEIRPTSPSEISISLPAITHPRHIQSNNPEPHYTNLPPINGLSHRQIPARQSNPLLHKEKHMVISFPSDTTYKLTFSNGRYSKINGTALDPVTMPVAGLPTIWSQKPPHHTMLPPPYISQPIPLPFSYTRMPEDQWEIPPQRPPSRHYTTDAVTQTTPPRDQLIKINAKHDTNPKHNDPDGMDRRLKHNTKPSQSYTGDRIKYDSSGTRRQMTNRGGSKQKLRDVSRKPRERPDISWIATNAALNRRQYVKTK